PVPDLTAQQVIEKYLVAIGGKGAIAAIKDMKVRANAQLNGQVVSIKQWHGTGNKFRSETMADEVIVQEIVYDGERGMIRTPEEMQELTGIELWDVKSTAPPVPEIELPKFAERMTLSGKTTVNGEEAYKITIATTEGSTISDYYSVKTGLKLRRVDKKFIYGRPMVLTTDHLDYKKYGGVLFPQISKQSGGPMGEVIHTIEEIEMNKGAEPHFFETGLPPISDEEDGE
ncbi:MAG: hypothetical protein M3R08_05340, partial [Bacteroidota bacterium]|nr:hypothetical protein [Bacteroidota bacterium]